MTPGLEAVLVLAGAFVAGAVNSTVGGGGLVQLPTLMAAYPQTAPATLLGTNKLASCIGTASAVLRYARHLRIDWSVVLPAAAIAFLASLAGAATARLLPPDLFRPLVPVMLTLLLAYIAWHKDLGGTHAPRKIGTGTLLLALVSFIGLGFFDGFFGPGVGSFLLVVFIRLFGYDYLHAAASARAINLSSNAAAVCYFGLHGNIAWGLGAAMAAANLAGAQAGTVLALRRGNRLIRSAFIVIVGILILKTGRDAWPLG